MSLRRLCLIPHRGEGLVNLLTDTQAARGVEWNKDTVVQFTMIVLQESPNEGVVRSYLCKDTTSGRGAADEGVAASKLIIVNSRLHTNTDTYLHELALTRNNGNEGCIQMGSSLRDDDARRHG